MLIDVGQGLDHMVEDATTSDLNQNSKGLQIHTDCDNDHHFNPSMEVQNHNNYEKAIAPNQKCNKPNLQQDKKKTNPLVIQSGGDDKQDD